MAACFTQIPTARSNACGVFYDVKMTCKKSFVTISEHFQKLKYKV